MAVLETILPAVARSSTISVEIYRVAALSPNEAVKDLVKSASAINNFASTLKQIGTIVKEDDRLPSNQVRISEQQVVLHTNLGASRSRGYLYLVQVCGAVSLSCYPT
jgi:hypothetical protein